MPPRGQDGGAARAGADHSLEETINATPIMKMLDMPDGEPLAKGRDTRYFSKHSDALSYVRAYIPGEVHPFLLLPYGGQEPEAVAVAMVCPGVFARVMLWPGMLRASGRIWAEKAAQQERARMGRE